MVNDIRKVGIHISNAVPTPSIDDYKLLEEVYKYINGESSTVKSEDDLDKNLFILNKVFSSTEIANKLGLFEISQKRFFHGELLATGFDREEWLRNIKEERSDK